MQEKKLNILFLASWYPTKEHRTLGNFVQRHAQATALLHNVCVVTAVASAESGIEINEEGNLCEVKVYYKKKLPVISYRNAMKRGMKKAREVYPQFDLAHVHVAYPAGIAALETKLPYVVTEHFSGYHPQSGFHWNWLSKRLNRRILQKAHLILPVSQHLAKAIRQFGTSTPMQKLSNVVDPDIFHPGKKKNPRFTFLHVSTLEERSKNIAGILRGFRKLEEAGYDFLLKIGGDGDLDELREKIKDHGPSQKSIETFGEKPLREIAGLMRESHTYVMFSHFENQPTTILEALCCGLPVVSSDVGGIPEEINTQNGILVPAEDEPGFAEALQQMMDKYSRYNSPEISKSAMTKYSYRAVAEEVSEIYLSVLRKDA